jgi:hypothetical protein
MVLHAVRQRNPATEGALRTQCKPVEVVAEEVIITFPFPFLREKLVDPQRKAEIQDALTEVLKTECRIKLVKASEYVPGPQARPTPQPPVPVRSEPDKQAPDARLDEQAPDAQMGEKAPDAQLDEQQVAQELTRWAEERGGQVKIVPPDNA